VIPGLPKHNPGLKLANAFSVNVSMLGFFRVIWWIVAFWVKQGDDPRNHTKQHEDVLPPLAFHSALKQLT
jgi:hypothetical protein